MDTVTAHLALSPSSPSPLEESFWSSPPSPLNSEFYSSLTSLDLKERFSTVSSTYASRAARMGIFKDAAKLATRKSNDPQLVAFPPTDSKLPNSKAEDSVSSNDTSTSTPDPSASSSNSKTRPRKPKTKRSFAKFLDLAIQGATKLSEDSLASPPPLSSAGSDVSEFALVTPPLGPSEVTIEVVKDSEGGVEKPTIPPTQNQSPDTHIRWRGAIPHHCFPACDAPYMVSYSACALQSDYYSYELYHQLCPKGSPSFHEYCEQPPTNVLDLGCGEGYWAAEAATTWKSAGTKVTAFDLLDLGSSVRQSLPPEIASNMSWVQGNFVNHGLPFKDESFDLVRMANLTLAIPYSRWYDLIMDIKRVLKPGGRLELIDDHLFFPEVQYPYETVDNTGIPKLSTSTFNGDTMDKVDGLRPASLFRSKSLKVRPTPILFNDDDDVFCDTPTTSSPPRKPPTTGPFAEFESKARTARNMEKIFESMLQEKYRVHPRPHQFLTDLLRKVFGSNNSRKLQSIQVAVPTGDVEVDTSFESEKHHVQRPPEHEKHRGKFSGIGITIEWDKKDKKHSSCDSPEARPSTSKDSQNTFPIPALPMEMTPKAAKMLLGSTKKPKSTRPYQPSGLIVLPSTFIPCDPEELEMHACKNSNLLLNCRYALGIYLEERMGKDGLPLLSHLDFQELMWEYDCFRRRRLNWPQDHPGVLFEDEEPTEVSPPKTKLFARLQSSKDLVPADRRRTQSICASKAPLLQSPVSDKADSIIVRTIRVFEATKSAT